MTPFPNLEYSDLLDKLAAHTNIYMRLITKGGNKDEIAQCNHGIKQLQEEIKNRKSKLSNKPFE